MTAVVVPTTDRRGWSAAAGLVLLSLVPALAGGIRVAELVGGTVPAEGARFGTAMAALVLGVGAVRRCEVAAHDAWMTRAYAIGVAAGTQAVFLTVWEIAAGEVGVTARAVLHAAAWSVNLAIAEIVVRRRRSAGRSGRGRGSSRPSAGRSGS